MALPSFFLPEFVTHHWVDPLHDEQHFVVKCGEFQELFTCPAFWGHSEKVIALWAIRQKLYHLQAVTNRLKS